MRSPRILGILAVLIRIRDLVGVGDFAFLDMRPQTFTEIGHAHARDGDGDEHEEQGEDGEGGEAVAGGLVVREAGGGSVPHAYELEDEVGRCGEVDEDDEDVGPAPFFPYDDSG